MKTFQILAGAIIALSMIYTSPCIAAPTNLVQQAYVKASNTGQNDQFGNAVAISGNTMVIGAQQESSSATGVNSPDDDLFYGAGAAYVYVLSGTNWVQQAYLKASNTGADDYFGRSVAISDDTIVVGAYGEASNATGVNGNQTNNSVLYAGAAYVFVRSGDNWTQQAYLKASNIDQGSFGTAVGISGDTIVVGANYESGNAATAGAAYVFIRSGVTWTQQAYLKASNAGFSDHFGQAVAIDGDTIIIGAEGERSAADGIDGNQADNSLSNVGAAYIFARSGSTWSQQAYVKASNSDANDNFGWSVAVSGNTAVVGAYAESSAAIVINGNQTDNTAAGAGAVYVFTRSGVTWSQQAYLKASNCQGGDTFGWSVSASGDSVLVGATGEDSDSPGINGDQGNYVGSRNTFGAAYLFTRSGGAWTQQAYIKSSYPSSQDLFGNAVAVSGDLMVVGAYWEDSDATGVFREPDADDNNDPYNDSASQSGAAYVFGNAPPVPPVPPLVIVSISVTPGQVLLECTGEAAVDYSILRRPGFDYGWSWIGSETAQPDGTFSFADNDPPSDSAFYQLVKE